MDKKFARAIMIAAALFTSPVAAQETEEEITEFNSLTYFHGTPPIDGRLSLDQVAGFPTRPAEELPENMMVIPPLSAEAKMMAMQTMMQTNPWSLRDMMAMMVAKKKALPGLTFDEVIESLQSKGFDLNMRPTGHNTPYKILRETFDPESPRLEMLSFCDLTTMRMIMNYSLEFGAFLPCRITVAEDNEGNIWLMTMDWDVRWLDTSPNPNRISDDLRERAIRVRENIEIMMEAAATGDF